MREINDEFETEVEDEDYDPTDAELEAYYGRVADSPSLEERYRRDHAQSVELHS